MIWAVETRTQALRPFPFSTVTPAAYVRGKTLCEHALQALVEGNLLGLGPVLPGQDGPGAGQLEGL